jgi:hypothetical protein
MGGPPGWNTSADLYDNAGTLHAQADLWDHNPPALSTILISGTDIYDPSTSTVTTTGASLTAHPCT